MKDLWDRLERLTVANAGYSLRLRPGASEEAIASLEKAGGMALPDDLRASLLAYDGQDTNAEPVRLCGCGFFGSAASIASQWRDESEMAAEEAEEEEEDGRTQVYDDGDRVDTVLFSSERIPFAGAPYWDQDNSYLDFIPGPAGTRGQVIQRVTECDYVVMASDLRTYLEGMADAIESKLLRFDRGEWVASESPGGHPAEWLRKQWRSSPRG